MTCRHQTQAPGVMHRLLSAGTHRLQHAGCDHGVAHAGCETCPPHRWLSAWSSHMHTAAWCPVSKQLPLSWGPSIAGSPSLPPACPQPRMPTPLLHMHTTPGVGWKPVGGQVGAGGHRHNWYLLTFLLDSSISPPRMNSSRMRYTCTGAAAAAAATTSMQLHVHTPRLQDRYIATAWAGHPAAAATTTLCTMSGG